MINRDPQTFLPAGGVRSRYGVSDMALWRWLRNERLGFPHPIGSTVVASGSWRTLRGGKPPELPTNHPRPTCCRSPGSL